MYARQLNHARFATRLGRRSRGSAVVLVVVSLVLMALLGAVYLQTTRVQSFTAREQESNIQSVIAAIIAQIQETLLEDLTDDPGNGNHLELYDYPWTNRNSAPFLAERFDGSTVPAIGGLFDDPWLGSSTPDFNDPANPVWRKITNLNGLFLAYDNDTGNFVIDGITHRPVEHEVDFRNWPSIEDSYSDTNLLLNSPTFKQLVDASGDGIPDSRWAWAPLRQIRDVQYVMAVRIVDLSGKININTALSLGASSSGTYGYDTTYADPAHPSFSAPFFHTPSELDLGGFVFGLSGNTPLHMAELNNALTHRFGTAVNTQVPLVMRDNFWLNQGRQLVSNTGAGYRMYGRDNTYELLRREGLNQDPTGDGRTLAIEEHMPEFLRRDANTETIYTGVDLSIYRDSSGTAGPTSANKQDWYELEPRKQMTGESGAAIFAWPRPDMGSGKFNVAEEQSYKRDINDLLATPAGRITLAEELVAVMTGITTLPGGFADVNAFAAQFTASMADYADDDKDSGGIVQPELTVVSLNGNNYYGFEALPFISEVYAQALYATTATGEDTGTSEYFATWEMQGNVGYAIEIRNPFRKPISLENVELFVGGTSWGMLSTITAGAGLTVEGELAPNEVLILYRDSNDSSNADDRIIDLLPDPLPPDPAAADLFPPNSPMSYVEIALSQNWPSFDQPGPDLEPFANSPIEVALSIPVADSATHVTYDKAPSAAPPNVFEQRSPTPSPPGDDYSTQPNNTAYWQHTSIGNGQGLNIIATAFAASDAAQPEWVDGTPDQPRNPDLGALGLVDKTGPGNNGPVGPIADTDLLSNQIIISDRGEFFHVGELAHVVALGPSDTQTIRERWAALGADSVEDFMLDFHPATGNLIETGGTNFTVPYAALLIDRLTTLSPRTDGVDNDGDGTIDNSNENIIPGLININTAPRKLLEKVIPVADDALRQEIARRIVVYREGVDPEDATPPVPGTVAQVRAKLVTGDENNDDLFRANPGIAHAGELFFLLGDLLTQPPTRPGVPDYTGDVEAFNGTRVDFLSNPAANAADGIANDREEMALLAGWLSQVGTVRSDYFAAYVLVRGYRAGGFNASDGLVEGARFIAIFRRNAADGEIHVQMIAPLHGRPYMVN